VSTRGLRVRVAQAGATVGHDALESSARHTYRDRRDRYASDAQHPAGGDAVARRAGVV
jgi:hypothetical protein